MNLMFYYILYLLLYPLFFILSFFRTNQNNKNLIIQTAKIGDYVNTSIMFEALKKTDIIIDKINYPFASNDSRIHNIYLINNYKNRFYNKLKLALIIFNNNYENVYIIMPNSFNLFLGQMSFSKNKVTLLTYTTKWYSKLLSLNIKKVIHTVEDLTLNSYLHLINQNFSYKKFTKTIQKPTLIPNNSIIKTNKFNIGISLTAANKLKTIDIKTWQDIFSILHSFDCNIYIFGLDNENILLDNLNKNLDLTNTNIISLLGKIHLKYLPYEISKMNLYISSDTGNSYIADSMNVPTINFAGPCFWQEQRPVYNSLIIKSNAPCTPYSSVFKTKNEEKCKDIFSISNLQKEDIYSFIEEIYKDFQY